MNKIYSSSSYQMTGNSKKNFGQVVLIALLLLLSAFITASNAQTLVQSGFTSVLTPQYMASGTSTRLPVMFRATVTGLAPSTVYRYYSQGATNSSLNGASIDFGTTNPGAGNSLLISASGTNYSYTTSPSVTTAGAYETFTSDINGNYTGWFGFVNTSNSRFTAGNLIFPSIVIASNTGTILSRRALNESITVLAFSTNPASINRGSFLKETTSLATEKNMVAIYDNTNGTGRPLYIAPVESIGVSIASIIAGYTTSTGGWNAIVPNNNANGVRRIEQRSVIDGNIVGCATDSDGVWPTGPVNTVNQSAGVAGLTISSADAALNSCCPTISVSASAGIIDCFNGTTNVLVIATGGVAPYTGTGTFNVGSGTYTYNITDANGCAGSTTITIASPVADTIKPSIYLQSSKVLTGQTGLSSTQSPYIKPFKPGTQLKSILTVGDAVGGYKLAGIPDGMGAFDNGNGTFTLLLNHEINSTLGIIRAHGGKGAFVSKWIINKSDLSVVSGSDLMQQVFLWDTTSQSFVQNSAVNFSRFCSADLPAVSAFYNSASGKGTTERIFMNGEESGNEGRAAGHIATGANAGKSYELPYLGKFSWENSVASPASGDKTVVVGLDDATGGQVYIYIGTKTTSGTDIDKAGLNNGKLFGIKVSGFAAESNTAIPAAGTRFDLFDFGNVRNKTGAALNTESVAAGITSFLRPEDGAWDPKNPNDFYFVTTNGFNSPTRLWRLRFDNILSPETGGTIEAVLNGTEGGQQMFDNLSMDRFGKILIQEDPGNQEYIARIWQYDTAKDSLFPIAYHDSTRFITGATGFLTRDEESSGIIDMSDILGQGMYLLNVQAHYSIPGELVEGGQLMAMYNPYVFGNSSAPDTIRSGAGCGATINLGTPATADNCAVASVTNNAPATFPLGTTIVTWTVTDASGNTATANQVVIVTDTVAPSITAPAALNINTNDGCTANGVNLGTPIVSDNCAVLSVTNNAPSAFPLGLTTVTWTVADTSGNTATATQNVTVSDTAKPAIYLLGSRLLPGITGASSTQTPYILPSKPGIQFKSILTVGDGGAYKMAGIPDGLGAFDNGDGTFTVLMNHEIGSTLGVVRAHGSKGTFVSKWIINKSDLSVVSGSDLMQQTFIWDTLTNTYNAATFAFGRFCSADLPEVSAFYNSASGLGTTERIFMNGEETGLEGKAVGHIVTGVDAGKSYELPYLGKFSWENSVASPASGIKTVVAGMDDGTGGQVYFYVGTKTNTGTVIDKAGLNNGKLFGVKVTGFTVETNTSIPAAGTRFDLFDFGNVRNKTGAALNTESVAAGVTSFLRPEDGAWDPKNPNDFYFVTTNAFNSPTRLWRLRFDNVLTPETGGTIEAVLTGTEAGQRMFDNLSADNKGQIMLQEDVGNNVHIGKIWQYSIAKDSLFSIGYHDSTRFITGQPNFLTQDEEGSGIIDVSSILGEGMYLMVDQAHYATTTELVEGGQFLAMYNPYSFGNSTAPDTIRVTVPARSTSATVNLGTPATADNCSVASVTNNAPASFPLGTTNVVWTVTDGSGNSTSVTQVVIVTVAANQKPVVTITSPANNSTFEVGDVINLTATATDADGTITKVEFYENGRKFLEDASSPYTYSDSNVEPGTYLVTAKAFDNNGDSTVSDTVRITVTSCSGSGVITAEGYANIAGGSITDLTNHPSFPNSPSITTTLSFFEYGPGLGDNYGGRLRGYICAPQTGDYTFYIASDDNSELWLSTDKNPANKQRIAYLSSEVGFRAYNTFFTQKSAPIRLVKGARYYIETLHKQSVQSDHLSVAWQLPNGSFEGPIAGTRLSPFTPPTGNEKSFGEGMRDAQLNPSFNVVASPNPSQDYFTVVTRSSNSEPISVRLTDIQGRVIEQQRGLAANGSLKLGAKLLPGVYFVEVRQGKDRKTIKLVKQ
jgi:hypothetical protein